MPNYITPPVPITLDQPRTLRFDNAAIHAAERQFKAFWGDHKRFMGIVRTIVDAVQQDQNTAIDVLDVALTDWSIICWAGLQHEAPMSYDQFCGLVPLGQVAGQLQPIITALLQGLFPQLAEAQGHAAAEVTSDASPLPTNGSGPNIGPEPVSSASSPTASSGP